MFLAGMLSSGRKLNAKDQYNLSTFRKQSGITDDEHWDVVASIGYSRGILMRCWETIMEIMQVMAMIPVKFVSRNQ